MVNHCILLSLLVFLFGCPPGDEAKIVDLPAETLNQQKATRAFQSGDITDGISHLTNPPNVQCIGINAKPRVTHPRLEDFDDFLCGKFQKINNELKKIDFPSDAFKQALSFYQKEPNMFSYNSKLITIANYDANSRSPRQVTVNLATGEIESFVKVAHGSGKIDIQKPCGEFNCPGDQNNDGLIDKCTHEGSRTNMTRVGFFRTGLFSKSCQTAFPSFGAPLSLVNDNENFHCETTMDENANIVVSKLNLHGLGPTNSEAFERRVVMHESPFTDEDVMRTSFGCPAYNQEEGREVMHKIVGGSLFYGYAKERCPKEMLAGPLTQVSAWEKVCQK